MDMWLLAGVPVTSFIVALSGALMPGPLLTITVGEGNVIIGHPDALDATEYAVCEVEQGNIRLRLPTGSAFDLDAETDCGEIDNGGFAFTPEGFFGQAASGPVAGGGADISLDLDTGSIQFEAL